MRVGCVADIHGHLPEIEPCDLLIVAGDLVNGFMYELHDTFDWLDVDFRVWLETVPAKEIIGVAGNHDWVFERESHKVRNLNLPWIYLEDQGMIHKGYKMWGSPWQPRFGNWAFNADEDELDRRFRLIPDDTEILITHGPPYRIRDKERPDRDDVPARRAGSKALADRVMRLPKLKLHVFGHIHHGYGQLELAECKYVNAALVDNNYEPVNEIQYIDLPDK